MYIRKTGYVTRQNTEGQTFFGGYTSYKEPKDEPYIVWKTGYVLSRKEEEKSRRISKSVELTDLERQGAAYYQVLASDTACDVCLSHDGAVYLVDDAVEGENLPPFHPNCRCKIQAFSINNPNDDPARAEMIFWVEIITYGDLSKEEQAQALLGFYGWENLSEEEIINALIATENISNVSDRFDAFFEVLDKDSDLVATDMDLPSEDVDYTMFRWEDYKGLTAYNPGEMQEMAYTDEDGFRRINIDGLDEPAYMAAVGSYYLLDENGEINTNGVVFRVYLSNGHSFYVVAGDMKADRDTNPDSHQYTYNPSYGVDESNADIIEFIIDRENMDEELWGNNFKIEPPFLQGEIVKIEKLDITVLSD